jgi:hypothetical protein
MTKTLKKLMQNIILIVLVIVGIWLLVLSILWYRYFVLFNKLARGVEVTDLKKVLEKLLAEGKDNTKDIKDIGSRIDCLEEDGRNHIQKVGLIRFNPFKELGGDHSFSLAILDAHDSGVIITGLHTRDRTRVYMKDIKRGASVVELSAEEKKALASAQKSRS